MDWMGITFLILISASFPLGLLWVYILAIKKGLISKGKANWDVSIDDNSIKIIRNGSIKSSVPISRVAQVKYAYDDGWTESKLVEDALNLFDNKNKLLAKFPKTAVGFESVYSFLESEGIKIKKCSVDAPSYLD